MGIKNKSELNDLLQEYNNASDEIIKEIYKILSYSESNITRQDLFMMTRKEKDILIEIMQEKIEQENKSLQK